MVPRQINSGAVEGACRCSHVRSTSYEVEARRKNVNLFALYHPGNVGVGPIGPLRVLRTLVGPHIRAHTYLIVTRRLNSRIAEMLECVGRVYRVNISMNLYDARWSLMASQTDLRRGMRFRPALLPSTGHSRLLFEDRRRMIGARLYGGPSNIIARSRRKSVSLSAHAEKRTKPVFGAGFRSRAPNVLFVVAMRKIRKAIRSGERRERVLIGRISVVSAILNAN